MKKTKKWFLLLAAVGVTGMIGGCTAVRSVTASAWWGDGSGMYVAYWMGTGFGKGDSKVEWCRLHDDNSLGCKNQADAERALNVKGRGHGEAESE